jgi:hypothetical protein
MRVSTRSPKEYDVLAELDYLGDEAHAVDSGAKISAIP